jgi:hypothetical protein
MENKGNKNPQMNQNPSAQSSSNSNTSNIGSASQSSVSGSSSNQFGKQNEGRQSSANKSGLGNTFSKENLNNLTSKLQEFSNSTVEKVSSLSTTQKVVGGSLLALGAGWVAMNSMNKNKGSIGSKLANAQNKLNKNLNKNKNK